MREVCGICGRPVNAMPDFADFAATGFYCAKCDFITCLECGMKSVPEEHFGTNAPCGQCGGEPALLRNGERPSVPDRQDGGAVQGKEASGGCLPSSAARDSRGWGKWPPECPPKAMFPPMVQVLLISLQRLGL